MLGCEPLLVLALVLPLQDADPPDPEAPIGTPVPPAPSPQQGEPAQDPGALPRVDRGGLNLPNATFRELEEGGEKVRRIPGLPFSFRKSLVLRPIREHPRPIHRPRMILSDDTIIAPVESDLASPAARPDTKQVLAGPRLQVSASSPFPLWSLWETAALLCFVLGLSHVERRWFGTMYTAFQPMAVSVVAKALSPGADRALAEELAHDGLVQVLLRLTGRKDFHGLPRRQKRAFLNRSAKVRLNEVGAKGSPIGVTSED